MKVVVLYQPNSEHGRVVETFVHDFQTQHQSRLELINVDSRDGSAMASLYDVVQYPSIMALREDGSLLKAWQGAELPSMDEVAYYTMTLT